MYKDEKSRTYNIKITVTPEAELDFSREEKLLKEGLKVIVGAGITTALIATAIHTEMYMNYGFVGETIECVFKKLPNGFQDFCNTIFFEKDFYNIVFGNFLIPVFKKLPVIKYFIASIPLEMAWANYKTVESKLYDEYYICNSFLLIRFARFTISLGLAVAKKLVKEYRKIKMRIIGEDCKQNASLILHLCMLVISFVVVFFRVIIKIITKKDKKIKLKQIDLREQETSSMYSKSENIKEVI